jgi:bifunctional DNA-binding transcriptional regulator/antitoxin component of YhaV-PrlF toxin-antitoxin module
VIPGDVRRKVGVKVGDLLEGTVRKGKIIFIPKAAVDREIAEGLEDLRQGRAYGPYRSANEMIRALHSITGKAKKKPKRR